MYWLPFTINAIIYLQKEKKENAMNQSWWFEFRYDNVLHVAVHRYPSKPPQNGYHYFVLIYVKLGDQSPRY